MRLVIVALSYIVTLFAYVKLTPTQYEKHHRSILLFDLQLLVRFMRW